MRKKMAWNSLLTCIWIISCCVVSNTTSECHIKNGQCVYDMKVGQQGKCDSFSSSLSPAHVSGGHISGSCSCEDFELVKNHMNAIKYSESNLKQLMVEIKQHMDNMTSELNSTDSKLKMENLKNVQLQNSLQSKSSVLNQTKDQLSKVLKSATSELTNLRTKLGQNSRDSNLCRSSLGTKITTPSALSPDFSTFYCGFEESNICHFTQDKQDNGDWTKMHLSASSQTGPKADHTYGNGHGYYMVLAATSPRYSSHTTTTARLSSQTFSPSPNYCIRFWYNMYGKDVKTFNVYAKVNGGLGYPIFTRTGTIDSQWHLTEIPLGKEYTASNFEVVFEATTDAYHVYHRYSSGHYDYINYNQYGNIAIDDVYIYNTTCSSVPTFPSGSYTRQSGNMTSYYTFHSSKLSWYDAVKACKKENVHSNLAVITDAGEQQYLVNLIKSDVGLTAAGQNGFYLNGNDEDAEGNYKWTYTGYPDSLNYTNWHAGQPNNVGSNQDCMLMEYPESDYEWGDVKCSDLHGFICEMQL